MTTFRDREISAVSKAEHTALLRAALQTGFVREAPSVTAHSGPILVEAELRAIVALTHNHWKNRLDVSVDVPMSCRSSGVDGGSCASRRCEW